MFTITTTTAILCAVSVFCLTVLIMYLIFDTKIKVLNQQKRSIIGDGVIGDKSLH